MIYNSKKEILAFWQATYLKMCQTPMLSEEHHILSDKLIDIAYDYNLSRELPRTFQDFTNMGLPISSDVEYSILY